MLNAMERIEYAKQNKTTFLDLSGMGLTALPEAIGQLTSLRRLNVSRNQLTALPEAIGELVNLRELGV
jgi:Leucine-rich repeat (LRR) protein